MVASKAPTWSEKKAMITAIEEVEEEVTKVEARVFKGETVGGREDKVSGEGFLSLESVISTACRVISCSQCYRCLVSPFNFLRSCIPMRRA